MGTELFTALIIFVLASTFYLFAWKADSQLKYLRIKAKKTHQRWDIFRLKKREIKGMNEHWQAFLLFPMLYPLELEDQNAELVEVRKTVKKIHIMIYLAVIAFVILSIYSEKVFAN